LTKRLLITGGTGFIGRQCLPLLLARGYEVHAITSRLAAPENAGVQWHQCDLLDTRKAAALVERLGPAYLLHFAWYTELGKYVNSLENFRWVEAGLNLLLAFARQGTRAVLAGSSFEYEGDHGACRETATPLKPNSAYGACKAALQGLQAALAERTGLSAAWGRIFYLYGPHEKPGRLVASVIRSLLKGEPALCSPGEQVRDFLYVEDAADAFVALMESDVRGPVNIASGQPIAVKEVVQAIALRMARQDLIRLGALPARTTEPHFLVADVGRLRDEVGWRPKYDLDCGLDRTIAWWRNQLAKGDG
jgi:nucleoside-diphosphate-sugar epimerase